MPFLVLVKHRWQILVGLVETAVRVKFGMWTWPKKQFRFFYGFVDPRRPNNILNARPSQGFTLAHGPPMFSELRC